MSRSYWDTLSIPRRIRRFIIIPAQQMIRKNKFFATTKSSSRIGERKGRRIRRRANDYQKILAPGIIFIGSLMILCLLLIKHEFRKLGIVGGHASGGSNLAEDSSTLTKLVHPTATNSKWVTTKTTTITIDDGHVRKRKIYNITKKEIPPPTPPSPKVETTVNTTTTTTKTLKKPTTTAATIDNPPPSPLPPSHDINPKYLHLIDDPNDHLPTPDDISRFISNWKSSNKNNNNNNNNHMIKSRRRHTPPPPQSPSIPPNLIFTYRINLLTSSSSSLSDKDVTFRKNVQNTIDAYTRAFLTSTTATSTNKETSRRTPTNVLFLDDDDCLSLLSSLPSPLSPSTTTSSSSTPPLGPLLSRAFRIESHKPYKADLCRMAALYTYGGYYFDIDLQVMEPFLVEKKSLVTVVEEPGRGIFQAFVASVPKHEIVIRTLEYMGEYYERALTKAYDLLDESVAEEMRQKDPGWNMGTRTMRDAFVEFMERRVGGSSGGGGGGDGGDDVGLLQELKLDYHPAWYKGLERRHFPNSCCCNFVVHDAGTKTVHFWSRIIGSSYCEG